MLHDQAVKKQQKDITFINLKLKFNDCRFFVIADPIIATIYLYSLLDIHICILAVIIHWSILDRMNNE